MSQPATDWVVNVEKTALNISNQTLYCRLPAKKFSGITLTDKLYEACTLAYIMCWNFVCSSTIVGL